MEMAIPRRTGLRRVLDRASMLRRNGIGYREQYGAGLSGRAPREELELDGSYGNDLVERDKEVRYFQSAKPYS